MTPRTAAFFDAMRDALRGRIGASHVEARCGASSATERLALVLRMVHAGRRRIVDRVYEATRAASALDGHDRFEAAARLLLENEAGLEADYAAIALGLPGALEAVGAAPWVVEVADFEECLHRLRVVGAPPASGRLRGPVIVRSYTVDAPSWTRAARRGAVDAAPASAPTLALIYRGPDARPRWHAPSAAQLGGLALAMGEAGEDDLARGGVSPEALTSAWQELARLGLLEARR